MPLSDDEKRRIARVLVCYTPETQAELSALLGWKKDRIRSMLGSGPHSPPTTDELIAIAEHAGIPTAFAINGWAVADPLRQLQDEVSALRGRVDRIAVEAAAEMARLAQALQEHRETGHPKGGSGGGG